MTGAPPIVHLMLTRVRVYLREPEALFWTFGFPLLLTIALGIAFRTRGPEPVHVAVEDGVAVHNGAGAAAVGSAASPADLAARLRADPELDVRLLPRAEAREALRTGRVALVLAAGEPPELRFDPTRPEGRLARLAVTLALERAAGAPRSPAAERPVTERGARYVDFLVPGLIGMNIMGTCLWGIGWSIVEARSRRFLKRLSATPMRRGEYLLAFVLGHLVLVGGVTALLLVFARVAFDVVVFGSLVDLAVVVVVAAGAFSGIGLLVASRTDNVEVLSGITNATSIPMFVGSGVFFPASSFPDALQPAIQALPLTALVDALRAVAVDGASAASQAGELAIVCAWGGASFALAMRIFRWT